jgi:hypothetical protein
MLRYQSHRHRFLMNESEQALSDAADGGAPRDARIAQRTLGDSRLHRLWESRHADLIVPVAENSRRTGQILRLRDIELKLLHRRALIRCIRNKRIVGEERDQLFSVFYGPKDTQNAILTEHRQYTLAVSSRVSTDHLIDVMRDTVSVRLLREYEGVYTKYFELYCATVSYQDNTMADATRLEMAALRRRAMLLIKRIHSEKPDSSHGSFEQQALLARSGRYPMRDYMVG